jgi:phosphatidylserine/phosphatidylglycerophosphate/cardiolipin synthase-like enzyme
MSVHAIAGSNVVLLGIDFQPGAIAGLLGFAIARTDHTEDERYWLTGLKTFAATDPGLPPGSQVSTRDHPVQDFQWSDFTAKPNHSYTYRVVAMRGTPAQLEPAEEVEVQIATHDEDLGTHAVFFNRGVAGSQAYARRFGDRTPDQVGPPAFEWLSRGLVEALLRFIDQARDDRFTLRAALYEAQYAPVLAAFGAARDRGADVRIVFDERRNPDQVPAAANRAAITAAGVADLVIPRRSNPSFIAHNKFIVLTEDGRPTQVWTGSTNITRGGIFGHSNVGHIVRDPAVAASFHDYWDQLAQDPQARDLRQWAEQATPVPAGPLPPDAQRVVFSPRPSLGALEWYRDRMDQAATGVFFTAAFGVNNLLAQVLAEDRDYLRYVLLERAGGNIEMIRRDNDNRVAVGNVMRGGVLERWLEERTTGLNTHVKFIHTKYMLIDPLTDDPLVITGSANFSDASTRDNDENMLVIRGNTAVADIYLGEFIRLFRHFYFRDLIARQHGRPGRILGSTHLTPDDTWVPPFYQQGSIRRKERLLFAG